MNADPQRRLHMAAMTAAGSAGNQAGNVTASVVIQAGVIHGDVDIAPGGRYAMPVPRQVPAGPPRLADRGAETEIIDELLAAGQTGRPRIVVISGQPGIGKSALAAWWLHAHAARWPDGQLHADLGGPDIHSGELPADVLARWLRALGVPPEWIPAGGAELTGLWRSVTAGKRLAILAENAATVSAVRMLLPGPGPSAVVVTSRRALPAVAGHGARFVDLGPLPAPAAVSLLGQIAGPARIAAEPEAARRLAGLCAGIPLALCAAGGQLAVSPTDPIADAAARYPAGMEDVMTATLDAAYEALDDPSARAYRRLSLHPGPDFAVGLAAAILDTPPALARDLLTQLARACLIEAAGPDRYRYHDLVGDHARQLAGREDSRQVRRAVTGQIAGWYLAGCARAEQLLQPYRHGLRRAAAPPPEYPPRITEATALDWLDRERFSLQAVVRAATYGGYPAAAWQLADAMWPLWLYRGHYREQLQVSRLGLAAARRCRDKDAQARALDRIGLAACRLGDLDEAVTCFQRACALWQDLRNAAKAAGISRKLGWIAAARGDHDAAIELYRTALRGCQDPAAGTSRQAALAMIDLGTALTGAGHDSEAIPVLAEAARLLETEPDPYNQARAQAALGRAQAASPEQAIPLLTQALETMARLGVVPARVGVLEALAAITAQAADPDSARACYEQALDLLPPGHPREPAIRQALDALPRPGQGP